MSDDSQGGCICKGRQKRSIQGSDKSLPVGYPRAKIGMATYETVTKNHVASQRGIGILSYFHIRIW